MYLQVNLTVFFSGFDYLCGLDEFSWFFNVVDLTYTMKIYDICHILALLHKLPKFCQAGTKNMALIFLSSMQFRIL